MQDMIKVKFVNSKTNKIFFTGLVPMEVYERFLTKNNVKVFKAINERKSSNENMSK